MPLPVKPSPAIEKSASVEINYVFEYVGKQELSSRRTNQRGSKAELRKSAHKELILLH